MRDITRIDIRKVNPYGRYIDLDKPVIFDLTDEEITALRKYYNKPNIASLRNMTKKTPENVKKNYKVTRDQKYNKGRHRTKRKIKKNYGMRVIIGGILVFVMLGSKYIKVDAPKVEAGDYDNSSEPSYTEYIEYNNQSMSYGNTLEGLVSSAMDKADDIDISIQEDKQESSERQEAIKDICNIYQLNYDVVYSNLVQLTNDFTSDNYLNGHIDGVTCKGVDVYANSEEELLVYTIRCMKQLPSQLGVRTDGLYVKNGYNSGTNYYEQLNKVANVLGVDRCLLYAIVNAESSFNSDLFLNANNPAGIKGNDGNWWFFDTKEEGFFELGMELLKYYRKIGVSPDNIDEVTLGRIRDIHAPLSDGNEHWLPNVLSGLEYAKMHEAEMFGNYEQSNGLSF